MATMIRLQLFSATLLMLVFIAGPSRARHFEIKETGKDEVCIMLDIDMNVQIQALKDGKVVAEKHLTPDDDNVVAKGECNSDTHSIAIFFRKQTMWAISFKPEEPHPIAMYRVVEFVPKEVFGDSVNITTKQGFTDTRPVYLKDKSHSYKCDIEDTFSYQTFVPQPEHYKFRVSVNVMAIHTQGYGLTGKGYGTPEVCSTPVHTTLKPLPLITTSKKPIPPLPLITTSKKPIPPLPYVSSTATPGPIVNTYEVKNGAVTCIAMETSITISIKYAVTGTKKIETAVVNVPASAVASGNCSASPQAQILSISFFKGWFLNITFTKDKRLQSYESQTNRVQFSSNGSPAYSISTIALTVVVDEKIFPGSAKPIGMKYRVISPPEEAKNFPKMRAGQDYFRCKSKSVDTLSELVQVKTENLKFKAFNTASAVKFDGKATVCSADSPPTHGPQSNAGLVVGLVIAAVVIAALAALLVMMIARRRYRYNRIQ